jgi:hypothetical protein
LETIYRLLPGLHVTFVEFAKAFERNLRAKDGAGHNPAAIDSPGSPRRGINRIQNPERR